jgi:hypothetical protein
MEVSGIKYGLNTRKIPIQQDLEFLYDEQHNVHKHSRLHRSFFLKPSFLVDRRYDLVWFHLSRPTLCVASVGCQHPNTLRVIIIHMTIFSLCP